MSKIYLTPLRSATTQLFNFSVLLLCGCSFIFTTCSKKSSDDSSSTTPTFTITFNTNGGSAIEPITVNDKTTSVSIPATPTREGYTFVGWYTDEALTKSVLTSALNFDFSASPITSNITLFAKWTPVPTFTITFNTNGGSAITPIMVNQNSTSVGIPANPTKVGYAFVGWYTDAALTKAVSVSTINFDFSASPITSNIMLYAKWDNPYIITYDINTGTGTTPQTQSYTNTALTLPDDAEFGKTDYFFAGWTTIKDNETTKVTSPYTPTVANTTLYALWKKHVVTFDANTGTITGLTTEASNLTEINIPATINGVAVTSIGEDAFNIGNTLGNDILQKVSIPNGVTRIKSGAFKGSSKLTSVTLPSTLIYIDDYAFWRCKSLTSITLPNSLISLGLNAFKECDNLTTINIPSNLTTMGNGAFAYCPFLNIRFESTTPPTISTTGNYYVFNQVKNIFVPNDAVTTYKEKAGFSTYKDIIKGY